MPVQQDGAAIHRRQLAQLYLRSLAVGRQLSAQGPVHMADQMLEAAINDIVGRAFTAAPHKRKAKEVALVAEQSRLAAELHVYPRHRVVIRRRSA